MWKDRRNPDLDWDRAEEADPRDPLMAGPPCNGHHSVDAARARHTNAYKVSYTCVKCGLRLLYVPRKGCHGKYRSQRVLSERTEPVNVKTIVTEAEPLQMPNTHWAPPKFTGDRTTFKEDLKEYVRLVNEGVINLDLSSEGEEISEAEFAEATSS